MSKLVITLELDVDPKDKRVWVSAANGSQAFKNLSEWCVDALGGDAFKDQLVNRLNIVADRGPFNPPAWMQSFNVRVQQCLIKARVAKPEELDLLLSSGFNWAEVMPDLGKEGYISLLEWKIQRDQ